jgi:thiazole biosynthesis/tRNA modification protein ThiI
MDNVIIIRYAEIFLKGLNRPYFERALTRNIALALKDIRGAVVRRGQSRVYVEGVGDAQLSAALSALSCVFGVHSFSAGVRLEPDLDRAAEALIAQVRRVRDRFAGEIVTFRVEAKRADKRFPMNSNAIATEAGARILKQVPGLKVDLERPQIIAYLEMRDQAYCYTEVIPGPGGMPVGCNGSATLLLSGGIDSPVAGCMIAKRGVSLTAVHYESFPYTSEKALEKVYDLARLMTRYTGSIRLHAVRFTDIQMKLYQDCPPEYLTILMRRFMMRIAERIARADGSLALVTGESVGQVASQTLESLNTTDSAAGMVVLRPLIGMDKIEITALAERYGTFATSILPYEDCCTVFVPRHPVTRPKMREIERAEAGLDIEAMIEAALAGDRVTVIE